MFSSMEKRSGSGNGTCPLPADEASLLLVGEPIVGNLTFQHLILITSIACAGTATVLTLWLILKHLHRYTQPKQQRQIIRVIAVPVAYAVLSVLIIFDYNAAHYIMPLRDIYEAFALASIFLLFVEYVAPDEDTREAYFFNLENRKKRGSRFSRSKVYDIIPGGSLKWFKSKWVAIFGYCIITVITTVVEEITQAVGVFCNTSLSPRFAQIWIILIQNVAIAVAVTSVILFYGRLSSKMTEHKPLAKLISFKLIVGVNFVQNLLFSLLTGRNVLKGSHKITGKDLSIGIPALLVAFEQVLFAIGFHYSFRSREYHESNMPSATRMGALRAAAHAYNPYDLVHGMVHAITLVASGIGPGHNGEWPKPRSRRYGKISEQEDVHLEPMSATTGPERTGHGYGYRAYPGEENQPYLVPEGYQRSRSADQTHRPPPEYDVHDAEEVNPYPSHVCSHSRDPSVDAVSARDMA